MNAGGPEASKSGPGKLPTNESESSDGPSRTEARQFRERVRNEPGRMRRNRPNLRRFVRILLGADEDDEY